MKIIIYTNGTNIDTHFFCSKIDNYLEEKKQKEKITEVRVMYCGKLEIGEDAEIKFVIRARIPKASVFAFRVKEETEEYQIKGGKVKNTRDIKQEKEVDFMQINEEVIIGWKKGKIAYAATSERITILEYQERQEKKIEDYRGLPY